MAFDGIFLHRITEEIQQYIPAKINRIHQVSDTELLFHIRHQKEKVQLLVSAHSLYNRINITTRKYPTPETPSNFVMLLRKYLEGGLLISLTQGQLDRWLDLKISTYDELGDRVIRHLYIELMGKYANVILVDSNGKIVDALKRIPPFENNKRIIQPGAEFRMTDPQNDKKNPFEDCSYNDNESFTRQFQGFSPLLSKELQHRMHNGESLPAILYQIQSSRDVYITEEKDQTYFHVIPLTQFSNPCRKYPIFEGLDVLYYEKEEKDRIRQQTGDLFKYVRREIKKYTSKLQKLEEALQEALDCEIWKERGDLLYAYLHLVKKGMTSVTVTSFETGEDVVIPLEPKLDGKQNARKCFQKYTKGRNGTVYISQQIDIARRELEYFENMEYQLSHANFEDAREIQEELANNGYLKAKPARVRKKKETSPAYQTLFSPDGFPVYFGKNNIQNEYVTFKKARKQNLWFHVKDMHGSHVILDCENPSETDIRYCAQVAAFFSDARDSGSIPVNWCEVRNLKKIPGGKTGMVTMSGYQTIYIDISDDTKAALSGR